MALLLVLGPHQALGLDMCWARGVLDAGDSVTTVDGQMIDRPVLERACGLLARAGG
ncbi:hypothetical protein [Streptomyces sp. NPDC059010]|uniref:hypothetical protein n=1 Tax=Streptomyces sp. NPDC059010 TaxID=3346695 RepID=UPI0036B5FA1D